MLSKIILTGFAGIVLLSSLIESKVYFKEQFDDGDTWSERWIQSKHAGKEFGKFQLSSGKFHADENDMGLQTSQDARFYGVSAKHEEFSNEGKDLVVQFQVKHEQSIDCGGGYVKLFGADVEPEEMHGDSPYNLMFGPDICGPGTKKVHVIFSYKGTNHLIKKDIRCKDDELTHLYTLVVKPDMKYKVLIDLEEVQSGSLEEDWDFLPPKMIKDPEAKKPEDWDDRENIPDPDDTKPEDWDKSEFIPDPDAAKPEDWDDEMDGEWEAPMINNPEYKGEWKPKEIPNPEYQGRWVHPEIANPEYFEDNTLGQYPSFASIGFDLWQVKSGTIFDNVIIADSEDEAKEFAEETFSQLVGPEKEAKEKADEEEKARLEAEAAQAKEDGEGEDDEEEEDIEADEDNEIHEEL